MEGVKEVSSKNTAAVTPFKEAQEFRVSEKFNYLLERLDEIPVLPAVATKINELIADPESSAADIADVMRKDQSLTAKVLKLINSPYYGIPGGVSDVQRALAFLGFNTISQLVLSISVFSMFPDDGKEDFPLKPLWKHALGVAVTSELIAKEVKHPKPSEMFTCGLLHDVGKMVLYQVAKPLLVDIAQRADRKKVSFVDIERELDVPTHGFLGEYIAKKWALPLTIRNTVRYHHTDISRISILNPYERKSVQIVALANAMTVKSGIGHSGDCSDGHLVPQMWEVLDLSEDQVKKVEKNVAEEMLKAQAFLAV